MTVPTIVCLLPGGVISDRLSRRAVMLAADAVRAVAIAALAVLVADRPHPGVGDRGSRDGVRRRHGVLHAGLRGDRARPPARVRPARGQLARPVRAADRAAPGRPGARRLDHRGVRPRRRLRRRRRLVRRRRGLAVLAMRPVARHAHERPVGDGRHQERPCASSAGAPGSGARSCRPRSPTCSSSARPRCCCRTSSRTACTGRRARSGSVFAAGGIGSIGAAVLMGQRDQPRRQVTFIYVVLDARDAGRRRLRPRDRRPGSSWSRACSSTRSRPPARSCGRRSSSATSRRRCSAASRASTG